MDPKTSETFEGHLQALEEGVKALEAGEATLEESLGIFEGAVAHLRACHEFLEKAEARVRAIAPDEEGNLVESDFEAGEET